MVRKVKRTPAIYPDWKDSGLFDKFMQVAIYGGASALGIFIVLKGLFDLELGLSFKLSILITLFIIVAMYLYARRRRRRIMQSPNPAIKKVVYYLVISVSIIVIGVLLGVTVFYEPDPEKVKGGVMGFRLMMAHGVLIAVVFLALYIFISRKEAKEEKEKTQAEKINNGQIYEIYKDVLKGRFVDISMLRNYLPSDENGVLDRLLDELVEHQEALRVKQGNIDRNGLEHLLVFAGTLLFSTPAGIDDIGEFYDEIKQNEELHSEEAIVRFLKEYIEVFHLPLEVFFSSLPFRMTQQRISHALENNASGYIKRVLVWSSIFVVFHFLLYGISALIGEHGIFLNVFQGPGNFLIAFIKGSHPENFSFHYLVLFVAGVLLTSSIAGINSQKKFFNYFLKAVAYLTIWVVSGVSAGIMMMPPNV